MNDTRMFAITKLVGDASLVRDNLYPSLDSIYFEETISGAVRRAMDLIPENITTYEEQKNYFLLGTDFCYDYMGVKYNICITNCSDVIQRKVKYGDT